MGKNGFGEVTRFQLKLRGKLRFACPERNLDRWIPLLTNVSKANWGLALLYPNRCFAG
jgi:hypothetical protein